jgi:hypothetical protein
LKTLNTLRLGSLISLISLAAGCSVVMEATRPTPVRLAQFQPGESRSEVLEKLGQPVTTTSDTDGANCDEYSLVLRGYGAGAKAGIAFGEFAADVLTLGIAEVVSTPTEIGTRNSKRTPVWFCYKKDALARVTRNSLHPAAVATNDHAATAAVAGVSANQGSAAFQANGVSASAPPITPSVAPGGSAPVAADAGTVATAATRANPTLAPVPVPASSSPAAETE